MSWQHQMSLAGVKKHTVRSVGSTGVSSLLEMHSLLACIKTRGSHSTFSVRCKIQLFDSRLATVSWLLLLRRAGVEKH
jgi:hypothetical protein